MLPLSPLQGLKPRQSGREMESNLWPSPLSRPCWISCAWSSVKPCARLALRVMKLQVTVNSNGRTGTAAGSPGATQADLTDHSPQKDSPNKIQTQRSLTPTKMASIKNHHLHTVWKGQKVLQIGPSPKPLLQNGGGGHGCSWQREGVAWRSIKIHPHQREFHSSPVRGLNRIPCPVSNFLNPRNAEEELVSGCVWRKVTDHPEEDPAYPADYGGVP